MKNQGGNQMRNMNNFRKNFQQQNFNSQQFSDQNPGFMDFSNNFNDQQQQQQRPQNNMNKRKMNNGQMNRSPKKMNFQNGGNKNWNGNNNNNQQQQQQRRGPPQQMMNQNQFQQFNPVPTPQMNQRMPQANFRNNKNNNNNNNSNNMRNGGPPMNNFPPMQGRRGPPQMNMPMPMPLAGPPGPIPPSMNNNRRPPPMRRRFPKFNNNANNNGNPIGNPVASNNQNRKNPNLTRVEKPKNRNQVNANRKNGGNRSKKRQRDPYSLEAPFVTDEIKEEHKKKEDILESLKGKGKNDELFARFKEQRDVFVKKYDEAKDAYQREKKVTFYKILRKIFQSYSCVIYF